MQDGEYTRTIYTAVKERHFSRAVELLEPIAEVCRARWPWSCAIGCKARHAL